MHSISPTTLVQIEFQEFNKWEKADKHWGWYLVDTNCKIIEENIGSFDKKCRLFAIVAFNRVFYAVRLR